MRTRNRFLPVGVSLSSEVTTSALKKKKKEVTTSEHRFFRAVKTGAVLRGNLVSRHLFFKFLFCVELASTDTEA